MDRDHVIGVAMDCYWREGTDAVPLNELCRRADVSKPGIYREFGAEDGLMDAILERYAATVLSPTWELTTHDRPFAELLTTLVGFLTSADGTRPAGCLLATMRVLSSHLGPATTARVEALGAHARDTCAHWVERAKARAEIAPVVPTTVAAAFVDTQFTTLLIQMALGADPALLRAQAGLAFAGLTGVVITPASPA